MQLSEAQANRALAALYYRLARGWEVDRSEGLLALSAWNRITESSWALEHGSDPRSASHLAGVAQNLRQSGFVQVCDKWRSAFDSRGAPADGRMASRFVAEAIAFQYRSLQVHRDFFCVCQTFAAETLLDFEIGQPLAPGIWTVCLTVAGTGYLAAHGCTGENITAGSIAVIPPGFSGTLGRAPGSPHWRCLYLAFRPGRLASLNMSFSSGTPTLMSAVPTESLNTIRDEMYELSTIECRCGDLDESLCFNLIENILIRLQRAVRCGVVSRRFNNGSDPIREAAEFILSHHDHPIALADLAERAHLSQSRLSTVFKDRYGMGPIRWRDSIRLSRARHLLVSSDASVADVAARVGWQDALYFSRRFKEWYGESPRRYRCQFRPEAAR